MIFLERLGPSHYRNKVIRDYAGITIKLGHEYACVALHFSKGTRSFGLSKCLSIGRHLTPLLNCGLLQLNVKLQSPRIRTNSRGVKHPAGAFSLTPNAIANT